MRESGEASRRLEEGSGSCAAVADRGHSLVEGEGSRSRVVEGARSLGEDGSGVAAGGRIVARTDRGHHVLGEEGDSLAVGPDIVARQKGSELPGAVVSRAAVARRLRMFGEGEGESASSGSACLWESVHGARDGRRSSLRRKRVGVAVIVVGHFLEEKGGNG